MKRGLSFDSGARFSTPFPRAFLLPSPALCYSLPPTSFFLFFLPPPSVCCAHCAQAQAGEQDTTAHTPTNTSRRESYHLVTVHAHQRTLNAYRYTHTNKRSMHITAHTPTNTQCILLHAHQQTLNAYHCTHTQKHSMHITARTPTNT